jgi:hypothetical protein
METTLQPYSTTIQRQWLLAFYDSLDGWPGDDEAHDLFLAFIAHDGMN